ncbi:hypothetical protein [Colwellia sp. TT2012]|uniref:hypothetical protein n=1 Tax=Colwellia sp. TT2012 TaxID=1720342 RepID=UPI000710F1C3|nr:hypothetical protein [Colwellia sp. TT2012]
MQNRKTLTSRSVFTLVQIDILANGGNVIRTSYEVAEPNEDVVGRFGSLTEAENFITLLSNLNQQSLVSP